LLFFSLTSFRFPGNPVTLPMTPREERGDDKASFWRALQPFERYSELPDGSFLMSFFSKNSFKKTFFKHRTMCTCFNYVEI